MSEQSKSTSPKISNIASSSTYIHHVFTNEMSEYKILVVDDEPDLREILQCNLENAGYLVDTASSAEEAIEILTPEHSLILLDVMLEGMSGFRMAEKLRKEKKNFIPIIFLTARDTENDLLTGFSAGGDDYISKPFSLHEVLARIKALLRRSHVHHPTSDHLLTIGNIVIDTSRKVLSIGEREILLSPKEMGILNLLAQKPGHVFSRETILHEVWHDDSLVLQRTVDVHIARIRRKLGNEGYHLINRQGYGYCIV